MRTARLPTLRWVLVAAVAVLVSCGGGSSLTQESPIIDCEANSANVDIWTPDLWVVADYCYKVGDTGPGGGIIVYVDAAGFVNYSGDGFSIGDMCLTGTCHYLEMAPTDLEGTYSWIDAMVAAEEFSTPSANDWLLPSMDALNAMCKYAFGDRVNAICNDDSNGTFTNSVGGLLSESYWSSSVPDGGDAMYQSFFNGIQTTCWVGCYGYVRPVRAF